MITLLMAVGTVVLQVLIVIIAVSMLFKYNPILQFVKKYAAWLCFGIATSAVLGSLYYSEIIGYAPCLLCWWQRVFIYPQVVILLVSFYLKDKKALYYVGWLSGFSLLLAIYHYVGQLGLIDLTACEITGETNCNERFVYTFNYITIPLMSLTAMLFNIIVVFIGLKKK